MLAKHGVDIYYIVFKNSVHSTSSMLTSHLKNPPSVRVDYERIFINIYRRN